MKKFFFIAVITLSMLATRTNAQAPTVQDCMGAIPVCLNTYNEYNGYTGVGNYNDIPTASCPVTCMSAGERNSVWYTFTVQSTGWFDFRITPWVMADDYDWALFNLTTDDCSALLNTAALPYLEVSCNWSADGGITGANSLAPNTGTDCWGSASTANNPQVWVTAGSTYYLNVSNFTGYGAGHGYQLDLTNGSAIIYDNVPPFLTPVANPACGTSTITITMSENVLCSSVSPGDFTVAGHTVTAVTGAICAAGGTMENTFTLTLTPGLDPGAHTVCINGTSGHISDLCGNLTNPADARNCRSFTVPGISTTVSGTPLSGCSGFSSTLTAAGATSYVWSGGLGTANPITVNPTSTTNYTVTGTTGGCTSSALVTLTVLPGLTVTLTATPNPICALASSTLTAGGATSYVWSGGLPAGGSNTVSPAGTTTYSVTGTSGACTGLASVTLNVNPNVTPTFTALGPYCQGDAPGALPTTSTNGVTGTWSPAAINTAAAGTTVYTFTPTAGLCATTTTMSVVVNPKPTPTFTALGPYCIGAAPAALPTTSTNGITGTWSPAAISTAAAGTTVYTFTPTAGLCANTTTMSVLVSGTITPTFTALGSYCVGAVPAALPTTSTNGITGTWSPAVISTASAGTTVYTFTPTVGLCATTTTMSIVVNANTTPTFTALGPYCVGAAAAALPTTSTNGITGTWSPAVISTAASGTTVYTFTPTAGICATTATMSVLVYPTPTVTVPAAFTVCNGAAVAATAFTGTPAGVSYTWTNSNTSIGLAASGSGNITGFTAVNAGSTPVVATITVTPSANGCTGTPSTYTITVNPTDNPAFNYTPSSLCQTGVDPQATITGGASGTFSSIPAGLVFLNTATGLIDLSASTLGTYTVTFTTSGPCTASASTTVNITSAPLATITYGGPYCLYDADPAPTFGAGASAGVFSSTAGLVFVSTATGVVDLSASTPGTYTITNSIAAAGGCAATSATATIVINPTPTVTVPAAFAVCNGATVPASVLSGTPAGVTYAWTNSNTAIGLAASGTGNVTGFTATNAGTAPITATITVTPSANGCTGLPQSYVITVNPTPTVSVPSNIIVCNGAAVATATFTSPTSGSTFAWTNDNTTIGLGSSGIGNIAGFTAVNTSSSPIVATIMVTPTANGCVGTASTYTITVNPSPVVTVPANIVVCNNAAVAATNFTSTTAGATFTWTNSNTAIGIAASGSGDIAGFTATNTGTTPITATISVTPSANGCTGTASTYTITVNPTPGVSVPPNVTVCNNALVPTAVYSSTTPGATMTWTNTNTAIGLGASGTGSITSFTATNTGTAPITATITVTPSANGCTGASASYTITVNPTPTVTVPANVSLCTGATVPALNFTSTTAGATFTWTNSNASIGLAASGTGNIPGFTAINTSASAVVSTITVTPSANGCTGTPSSFTITVNPLPQLTFPALAAICVNAPSLTLSTATPAGGIYSGTGVSGGSFNPAVSGTGTFVLTYTYTSASSCTNSTTQNITVNPQPTVTITPQGPTICLGNSVALTAFGASTYNWTPATGLSGTSGNLVSASPLTTTIYVVTGTDNGCTNSANVTVNVITSIPVTITPSTPSICPGESTILSAGGAVTYVWAPGAGLSSTTGSSVTASPSTTTIYNVVGTDLAGCTGSANAVVNVYPLANINFLAVPKQGCAPLSVNFLFTPGVSILGGSWLWNFGDNGSTSTDSAATYVYNDYGSYTVTLTAQTINGCDVSAGDTIVVHEVPLADFIANPEMVTTDNATVNFIDQSINATQWDWDFGDPSSDALNNSTAEDPSHTYGAAGDYLVILTVENEHGCTDTAAKTIIVNDAFAFWIPNAFSPNEDLVNDLFLPQGVGYKEETYAMRIFDRWGKTLLYTEDINKGWDGTDYNTGKMQPDGVYTYHIFIKDESNKSHDYVGSVILLR